MKFTWTHIGIFVDGVGAFLLQLDKPRHLQETGILEHFHRTFVPVFTHLCQFIFKVYPSLSVCQSATARVSLSTQTLSYSHSLCLTVNQSVLQPFTLSYSHAAYQSVMHSDSLLEASRCQLENKLIQPTTPVLLWLGQSASQLVSVTVSQYENVITATSDRLVTLTVSRPGRASQARNRPVADWIQGCTLYPTCLFTRLESLGWSQQGF